MPTKKTLDELIVAHGLQAHADLIRSLRRSSISAKRKPVDQADLAPTASRLGGVPHLPPGHIWPIGPRGPMCLLAQINLADTSPHDAERLLPTEGLLYFWYDFVAQPWGHSPDHAVAFRVEYIPSIPDDLVLGECPEAEPQDPDSLDDAYVRPEGGTFLPCAARFSARDTLPNDEWITSFAPHAAAITERERAEDWLTAYDHLVLELNSGSSHRLLGHPDLQQGPMELECERGASPPPADPFSDERELRERAGDWRLLLQLRSDEDGPGWLWGDDGVLFFCIREKHLAARDFSKCWITLQTS